jgi:hypothetical protein
LYFYAGATNTVHSASAPTVTWIKTSNTAFTATTNTLYASIGYNTINTAVSFNAVGANNIVGGIAANVIFANGKIFVSNTAATKANSNTLVFSTTAANSFVVVMAAASNTLLGSFTTNAAGGTTVLSDNGLNEWVGGMVFNSLAVGTYNVVFKANTPGTNSLIAMTAFVFPSYSVTFNDIPGTANIVTNGINQNTGNSISALIGTGTINAIAPNGNFLFKSWTATQAANFIFTSSTASNTFLTVEGNGIVTANFNALTTFTETGLPASLTWNVVYNGLLLTNTTAIANSITFANVPTNTALSYTVNDVFGAGTYIPSPASGTLIPGNILSITYTLSSCFITVSNTLIGFGNIKSGLSVSTANAVKDTNNGNVQANVLVAGGLGTSSPYNGIWIGTSSANQIGISNTLWNPSSLGTYSGNALSNTLINTNIVVGAGGSNTVYFGMGVPGGTVADSYTTNIVLENSC